MPILREWRVEIRRTNSEGYVSYIRSTGLADYRGTPGNLGALTAVQEIDIERVEVITMSRGVAPFAGQGMLAFAIATGIARRIGWSGNGTKPKCR